MPEKEYTYEEVMTALCSWEWINEVTLLNAHERRPDWINLREDIGSLELRSSSLTLAKWLLKVHEICLHLSPDIFDGEPFDWGGVPEIMSYAVDSNDGLPAFTSDALISPAFAARWIVRDRTRQKAFAATAQAASEPEAIVPPSHWEEQPGHPSEDWQYEVANGDTRLGYLDWVVARKENGNDD